MSPLRRQALAVFAAALAVRLAFAALDGRGEGERFADAQDYHSYAESLLERGEYESDHGLRAGRMPGYPLLLAAQYATLGRSPWVTAVIQALVSAGTCVLTLALAARWLPAPWPLAAGLLAAATFDLFEPVPRLLTEVWATFLLTLALWLLADDRALRAGRAAGAGAAAAALYLVRPEFLPWTVLAAAHAGWRSRLRNAGLVLAASVLVAGAWSVRNARVLGRPLATTTLGAELFYGWGLPRTIEERLGGPAWERAPAALSETERIDFYKERLRRFYLMEGLSASALKALLLNVAFNFYPFSPALDPTIVFLLPLALWGLWAGRRDGRRRLLALTIGYLIAVYSLVGVMIPRHRQVLAPAFVLLATGAMAHAVERFGARRAGRLIGGWALLCLAAWAAQGWLRAAVLAARDRLLG